MLSKIRDKALQAALPLLSTSAVGRLAVRKALEIVQQRTGIPIAAEYRDSESLWYVTLGEPGADINVSIQANTEALAALAEDLVPDLLEHRKIPPQKILNLLLRHMRKEA